MICVYVKKPCLKCFLSPVYLGLFIVYMHEWQTQTGFAEQLYLGCWRNLWDSLIFSFVHNLILLCILENSGAFFLSSRLFPEYIYFRYKSVCVCVYTLASLRKISSYFSSIIATVCSFYFLLQKNPSFHKLYLGLLFSVAICHFIPGPLLLY